MSNTKQRLIEQISELLGPEPEPAAQEFIALLDEHIENVVKKNLWPFLPVLELDELDAFQNGTGIPPGTGYIHVNKDLQDKARTLMDVTKGLDDHGDDIRELLRLVAQAGNRGT